jgi:hypothetical protein
MDSVQGLKQQQAAGGGGGSGGGGGGPGIDSAEVGRCRLTL